MAAFIGRRWPVGSMGVASASQKSEDIANWESDQPDISILVLRHTRNTIALESALYAVGESEWNEAGDVAL